MARSLTRTRWKRRATAPRRDGSRSGLPLLCHPTNQGIPKGGTNSLTPRANPITARYVSGADVAALPQSILKADFNRVRVALGKIDGAANVGAGMQAQFAAQIDEDPFVQIRYGSKVLLMFSEDLRSCGELLGRLA